MTMKSIYLCIYLFVIFVSAEKENSETVISYASDERQGPDLSTSIWIILGFLSIILLLFSIGFGCSYLCYQRSAKKLNSRQNLPTLRTVHPQISPHALHIEGRQKRKRGVPNWYAPSPKDNVEDSNATTQLIQTVTVPTQIQTYYGS